MFQRNYDLQSVGSTEGDKVQSYVAGQLQHHRVAESLAESFHDLQITNPEVDLSRPRFTAHGRFSCNLHIVMAHVDRRIEARSSVWVSVREMIRKACATKGHLLSRVGILPDHLHITLGTHLDESPGQVALSYMNNIAFARDMQPVLAYSCYVGAFGAYDLGAIGED